MPLILNGDGSVGPLSATEVGFLDGVTSSVQTQLNSKPTGGTGAWLDYSPAWTGEPNNPILGNGSLTGRWTQIGKVVHFRLHLFWGSTTSTTNSGNWRFTLPTAALSVNDLNGFSGRIDDFGTGFHAVTSYALNSTQFIVQVTSSSINLVGAGVPITWANGDQLWIKGTYEVP